MIGYGYGGADPQEEKESAPSPCEHCYDDEGPIDGPDFDGDAADAEADRHFSYLTR